MLQAYFGVCLKAFTLALKDLWVGECKPIGLVTVRQVTELPPMIPHYLFVVVVDEGLEYLSLLRRTRIDLSKQRIYQKPLHNYGGLVFPNVGSRHV